MKQEDAQKGGNVYNIGSAVEGVGSRVNLLI